MVTPEGTIYLARYTDDAEFSITNMVSQAFTTLPASAALAGIQAKVEKIPGPTAGDTIAVLTINGIAVGKLDTNTQAGTSALIIGVKK